MKTSETYPVSDTPPKSQTGTTQKPSRVAFLGSVRSVLVGVGMFAGMELLLARPSAIWSVLFVLVGVTLVLVVSHGSRAWRSQTDRNVVVLSLVLTASSVVFLLFPSGKIVQHTAAVILSVAVASLIFLLRRPVEQATSGVRYKPSEAFVLLTAFLVFTDIAGLSLFFSYWNPTWNLTFMMLALVLAAVGLGYQFYVFQGLPRERLAIHVSLLGLLIAQVAWGLTFWPTDVFSRGAVLFVIFYLFVGLSKHAVKKSFTWPIFAEYMGTSAAMLILLLATTQWTF